MSEFSNNSVAEKQICSSLHHLWKALHGGSLHHPSNLISNHLPTHHAALPHLGLLSHLQRHQTLSSKCTCLLGSLNFLLRAIPLLRNQLPCWNQNFTPPLSLTIPLPCLSSLHGTHHHLPSHYHTNILSVGFFFASSETQGTQRKEIRLKGFPTLFPVMSTTSDTWKMPGKYLQNEWMRYSSVWGTFKKGPCFFFLIVSQCVAKGWKAAWGCREEQEGYSGLRCHRKQPQCLSWPLLAEIWKNWLKHSLYLEAPLKTECLCPTPTPNLCWNPNPYVIVLRGRAFGRWLSHVGRVLGNEISAFIKKEIPQKSLTPLLSCEDTADRRHSMNWESGLHQTLHSPGPWSWTSQFPALWEINCLLFT